jgi:cytochrome c5
MALTLAALLVVSSAYGQVQTQRALSGNIPFEFTIGKRVLPAGTYGFTLSRNTSGFLLLAVTGGAAGKITVPVMTQLGQSFDPGDARLVFDTTDSKHALSEVWMPQEGGLLIQSTPKNHTHDTVIAVVSGPTTKLSGDKIYEQTCQKCHGPKGQGNPAADKFFQVSIPRLDSAVVQGKSDEELKDIISHGKRNMPPVRIGQATVQHLLPPDSVEAVIRFVRSFKQQ